MPTTSEVSTRLSADNSNYRSVMQQSEDVAGRTGTAILRKLDIRAGVAAIALAVGFSIGKVAEGIARLVSDMSKETEEALEKVVKLGKETAEVYERIYAKRRSDSQNIAADEEKQNRLLRERQEILERLAKDQQRVDEINERQLKRKKDKELVGSVFSSGITLLPEVAPTEAQATRLAEIANELAKLQEGIDDAKRKRSAANAQESEKNDREEKQRLKEYVTDYHAWSRERINLEEKLRAQKLEAMKPEERIAFLVRETAQWKKWQAVFGKESNEFLAIQVKINENNLDIEKEQLRLAEAKAKEEKKVTEEKRQQILITSSGRGDRELSDRELQRKIANIQQDIFQRQVASPGQADFFLNPQRSNLAQTQAELNLRRDVRQRAAAFGEERAFQQFPGLTEQRFSEIIKGIDTSSTGKLVAALDKLNQRLDAPLLATLKPTPFGP